ncbi:MAG: DUF5131 family protein [Luteolibacter sp.]
MKDTPIQWADSTVNPVMGCDGCELWPTLKKILTGLINFICQSIDVSRETAGRSVRQAFDGIATATAVWHARDRLVSDLKARFPVIPRERFLEVIKELFRCYAGILHLRHGTNPENSEKKGHSGYAAIFEHPVRMPGRMELARRSTDLRGCDRPNAPWLNGLPRLIFVSDMGDALSERIDFDYLKTEIAENVTTADGARHQWLWLTKRPGRMAEFATWLRDEHGAEWPDNLVAMTSVTNRATRRRIDELRDVPATIRGLSVEPLVEDVTLDLEGIDWLIVGGESGEHAPPFDLAWARSLRDQCREAGVAFFVKQLGTNPVEEGFPVILKDGHGGAWDEWPDDLRIREFPRAFSDYRATDEPTAEGSHTSSAKLKPIV